MNKRIITILAIVAVLAFSAAPAFAGSSTGVSADITAHIKGQDLPLYSISIVSGSSLNYNVLDGNTVEVGKKGERLDADQSLVVLNNGTQAVDIGVATNGTAPQAFDGMDAPIPGTSFALCNDRLDRNAVTEGLWEFAVNEAVPVYIVVGGTNGTTWFNTLDSGSSDAFLSRLSLPTALPMDAPTTYRWSGTIYATAAGI